MKKLLCKWLGHRKRYTVTTGLNGFRNMCGGLESDEKDRNYYCGRCDIDLN